MEAVIARQSLYLDKTKERVLQSGHPDSATLLISKGGVVPKGYESRAKKPEAVPQHIKDMQKVTGGQKAIDAAIRRNLTVQTKEGRIDPKSMGAPENKEIKAEDDKSNDPKPAPDGDVKDDNKKDGQGQGGVKIEKKAKDGENHRV